ncbi:MAG: iron-sulfur cluster assembly accessory protein [Gammaproteobacteria bacterium]
MITVTPDAAKHIKHSAEQGDIKALQLRIAASRNDDGSLHYGLGFDDNTHDGDQTFTSEGIVIIVAPSSNTLLTGTVIDYVELEPGKFEVIFINPNDPAQQDKPS